MPDCNASSSPSCNFHCPAGGTWYACPDQPFFVGCCSSDPCTGISPRSTSPCPENGLYPASFNPAIFDRFLPNTCIGEPNANWYTCNFTTPPFLGCCISNPCVEGNCSARDLVQAAWSPTGGNKDQLELFQDEATGSDGLSGGAIAGIVIGAVAAFGIVLALGWLCMRRRRRRRSPAGDPHGPGQTSSDGGYQHSYPSSPYQGSRSFHHSFPSILPSSLYNNHRLTSLCVTIDSRFSSPPTTAGHAKKLSSGSPTGFTLPPLSPHLPSESGFGDAAYFQQQQQQSAGAGAGQMYGLGVLGAQAPVTIQELDDREVHELEGSAQGRR
ncbi:hypothetical protein BDW74DRAFT_184187 [Aspergillus multicolor]|uniref:uncharacterized protein n=1 Tax=Aspergillus multicolor TaxID=41759 RepID=UPI003CCD1729